MGSFDEEDLVLRGLTTAKWRAELQTLQSNTSMNQLLLWVDDVDAVLLKVRGELLGQCLEKLQTIRSLQIWIKSSASSNSVYLSELVSGLKRNPNLTIETLYIYWLREPRDAIYISEIIRRTTYGLKFVQCELVERLSEDAKGPLASSIVEAVQLNLKELEFLVIRNTKGLFELLRKIFPAETDSGRRSLPNFYLNALDEFPEECWGLFPILAGNMSTICIEILYRYSPRAISWWEAFADALRSSPVMSIEIGAMNDRHGFMWVEAKRHTSGSLKVIPNQRSASHHDYPVKFFQQMLADNPRSSSSITELALRASTGIPFSKEWWEGVFSTIKSNTSVTSLDLTNCTLSNDLAFELLRSLLRVNLTIKEVKIESPSWRNSGKAALIEETVVRNKKAATEFSILKAAGFEFGEAKVGRLFLCGSPYAGKTQLKLGMMKLHHKRSRSASKPGSKLLELRRTKGAEVEVLMNNKKGQVSVWDLAGQYIFRALHDLILPRTSQSLAFVFAFNPYQGDSKKKMKEDVYDAFARELEEWLKFVASHCQTSGDEEHLPQVLIVITHRDLTSRDRTSFECGPESPVQETVERFESIFRGIVKLVTKVYHVDARKKAEVRPVLDDILAMINNWSKRHLVPVVCSDISLAMVAHAKSFSASPVWSLSNFYSFCHGYQKRLKNASPEVLFTIASYLHDIGRIIIVPKCEGSVNDEPLIIVDPNWCTEIFLGTLIAVGKDFVVHGDRRSGNTMMPTSSDGFISEWRFESLLRRTLQQMNNEGIKRTFLEDLLQRLNLCYRLEDGTSGANSGAPFKYFVPVICGGLEEKCHLRRELKWEDGQTEGCEYLGYRLHCEDPITTSFNTGVFSRFQIKFRRKLMKRFGIKETDRGVSCGLGLLKVMYDGYEVLVESDEVNGQHVDIMVKSSQPGVKNPRTRMQIISFLHGRFIRKLQKFYASSSGCPGISLVVGVIRTSSVQNLVPIWERRAPQHSIALEEMKNKLRMSIDLKLQDMGVEVDEESLLNFQHRWPDGELELVKDILGSEDLTDILSYVRRKIMTSNREVRACSNEVHQMLTKLPDPDVALPEAPEPVKKLLPRGVLNTTGENLRKITQNHEWSRSANRSRKRADEVKQLSDEVYEIYTPLNDCPRLEVVFIHGVPEDESDPKPFLTMWSKRNEEPDRCWLNTWLTSATEDLRLGRVLTVSYDCGVEKRAHTGNMDSFQVAETLAQALIKWARVGQQSCPVILVGHCLGGLVIKELCCEASKNVEAQNHYAVECHNFLKSVKGIFYYSTPHLGWSQSFSSEVQPGDMMECLQLLNKYASRVNFQFEQLRRIYGWTTRGVGESNPTKLLLSTEGNPAMKKLIVEEASARGGCLDGFSVVPDTDHFTICRPESTVSDSFLHLVTFIKDLLQEINKQASCGASSSN